MAAPVRYAFARFGLLSQRQNNSKEKNINCKGQLNMNIIPDEQLAVVKWFLQIELQDYQLGAMKTLSFGTLRFLFPFSHCL